jgi:hypothetical protein
VVHKARKLEDEEFKAKLEMTKAFCDTAKSYVQISSAGVALPLVFRQAILGDTDAKRACLDRCPGPLKQHGCSSFSPSYSASCISGLR